MKNPKGTLPLEPGRYMRKGKPWLIGFNAKGERVEYPLDGPTQKTLLDGSWSIDEEPHMKKTESPAASLKRAEAKAKRHALEDAFALQIRQMNLDPPERQVQLVEGRKWTWDFVWRDRAMGVAVEINGGTWNLGGHSSGVGIQRDADKANAANLLGYCVLAFTGDDVKSGRAIETLKKALVINQEYPF